MTGIIFDLRNKSITEDIYNAISNNFKKGENNLVIFFCGKYGDKMKKWVYKIEKIKNGYDLNSDGCGNNKLTKDKNGKISASTQAVITDIRNFIKDGIRHVVRTCSDLELINLELEEHRLDIIAQKKK